MPLLIFWEIVLLLWFSTLPGILVLSRIRMPFSLLERFVLGTALGFGITPLVFKALALAGAWQYAALVISAFNVLALILVSLRGGTTKQSPREENDLIGSDSRSVALLCSVAVALTLFYNFSGIHYADDGSLQMRGLFAVDVPFLIGIMPSFDLYGHLADMHQNGLQYAYHDFTYVLIAVVHQVAGTEYFSLIAYSFPLFGMSIMSVALYTFCRSFIESAKAFGLALLILLLSSSWGDHLLTGALSPSYLAGIILLIAILLAVRQLIGHMGSARPIGLISLLFVLLVILIKSKLPIYLVLGGSLGILGLSHLKKDRNKAFALLLPCILSLPLLLLFSEDNPYQPAGDFIVGAPLLGYGNQLASLLHIDPGSVDPIITTHHHETEDLLIIPYTVIHILRMILLDARLLLFVLALVLLRKKLAQQDRWLLRLGSFAILLGIILPILYSPAWYPLAISFYTPEIGAFVALILVTEVMLRSAAPKPLSLAIGLIAVYGLYSAGHHLFASATSKLHQLSSDEVRGLRWLDQHSAKSDVVVSNKYDLEYTYEDRRMDNPYFESMYLPAALSQRQIVSSGGRYGSLLASMADADTLKGLHPIDDALTKLWDLRMRTHHVYQSSDIHDVPEMMHKLKSKYVIVWGKNRDEEPQWPEAPTLFDTMYSSKDLSILRLKD